MLRTEFHYRNLIHTCVGKTWGKGKKLENIFIYSVLIHFHTHKCTVQNEVQVNFKNHFRMDSQASARLPTALLSYLQSRTGTPLNSKSLFSDMIRMLKLPMDQSARFEKQNLN